MHYWVNEKMQWKWVNGRMSDSSIHFKMIYYWDPFFTVITFIIVLQTVSALYGFIALINQNNLSLPHWWHFNDTNVDLKKIFSSRNIDNTVSGFLMLPKWVMWFIFWLISLCKIFSVCLFVCPGSAKEVMLNQPADARSLSHQASCSRNRKYIQHCSPLFFLVLYSLPSVHINLSFPLTLCRRENRFVFYLQRREKNLFFSLYSIYLSLSSSFISHISYVHDRFHYDSPFLILYEVFFLLFKRIPEERTHPHYSTRALVFMQLFH